MQAAAKGQADDVSEVLNEMEESGLEPGPYAYHALVFAHVKVPDPDPGAALDVMRLMHSLGTGQAILLIHDAPDTSTDSRCALQVFKLFRRAIVH